MEQKLGLHFFFGCDADYSFGGFRAMCAQTGNTAAQKTMNVVQTAVHVSNKKVLKRVKE